MSTNTELKPENAALSASQAVKSGLIDYDPNEKLTPNTKVPAPGTSPTELNAPPINYVRNTQSEPPEGDAANQTTISTKIPDEFKGNTTKELINYLEGKIAENQPLTKAEIEKLRRKQRAEGIISGIADAVQSVSNLIFTHHYAPNMYNANESMSAKAKERFDKAKAERDAENDKYFNYVMTIGKLKDAEQAKGLEGWKTEQDLLRKEREYQDKQKNKDLDNLIKQYQADYYKSHADKENANADKARIQAEMEADKITSIINKNNRSGIKVHVSRGKGGSKIYTLTTPGGTETYTNAAEYNAAAYAAAERYGIPTSEKVSSTNQYNETTQRDRHRSATEVAGALKSKAENKNKKKTNVNWK